MTNRYTALINQEIKLEFEFRKDGNLYNADSVLKVEIYDDYNKAVSSSTPIQIIDSSEITNISTGIYEYTVSALLVPDTYYDKIYLIPDSGEPEINIISSFYVQQTISGIPGNAIEIEYPDPNPFLNTNGAISYRGYDKNMLLYSSFDVNEDSDYAIGNKTAVVINSPIITAGGVFGNYVDLIGSSKIKYDKCNFANNYVSNTIKARIRLGFDKAQTYQKFLLSNGIPSDMLSENQNIDDIQFYSSFNNNINAIFSKGNGVATSHLAATYGPGGKFGNQLILSNNDPRYISYDAVNNIPLHTGTINFWIKSNYSGSPSTRQIFVKIWNGTDNSNKIVISHETSGNIKVQFFDNVGTIIFDESFGVFTPNISEINNIEFDYNLIDGENRLFINGQQKGSTNNEIGIRENTNILQIGDEVLNNNFDIDEFVIFNKIKHTNDFSPSNTELPQTMPYSDDYEFKLKINDTYVNGGNDIAITINPSDTWEDLANNINNLLTNSTASVDNDNRIKITADNIGHNVEIQQPGDGNSLVDLLDGVGESVTPNGPSNDNILFDFYNGIDNSNRISLIHTTDGKFLLKMWDENENLKVNNDFGIWSSFSNIFYEIVLEFNENIAQLFIDGNQFGKTIDTNFSRTDGNDFIISGVELESYGFDELIIYNGFKYISNYTVNTTPMTKFPIDPSYFTLNYGTGIYGLNNIIIDYSGTIKLIPIVNGKGYYLSGMNWLESDLTYSQSITPGELQTNFATIPFDGSKQFKIKVFFDSDGTSNVYLNRLYLNSVTTSNTNEPDYSVIINWVRRKLGEPTINIELDNSQIEANIQQALQRWLYYRNSKDDFMIIELEGSSRDGFDIPPGWEDFYDVVFAPRSPVSGLVYSGDWGKNIYLQYYYSLVSGGGGFMSGLLSDFYLTLSAMSDAKIILGFQPTYQVLNGKLYLHPMPETNVKIGLYKRRMPNIEQLNNDTWFREYVLALSKIVLGEIRETIGQLPVGDDSVPLNGTSLIQQGTLERDKLDEQYLKRMEPLFLDFF